MVKALLKVDFYCLGRVSFNKLICREIKYEKIVFVCCCFISGRGVPVTAGIMMTEILIKSCPNL